MKFKLWFTALALMLTATAAQAGVMSVLKTAAGTGSLWAGLAVIVLLYVFKQIPNENIYNKVKGFCRGVGVTVTLGLGKWKYTAPLWNATIEPWIIDLIDNTVGAAVEGFILGLRSDNNA